MTFSVIIRFQLRTIDTEKKQEWESFSFSFVTIDTALRVSNGADNAVSGVALLLQAWKWIDSHSSVVVSNPPSLLPLGWYGAGCSTPAERPGHNF